jgi:hypothetical protein
MVNDRYDSDYNVQMAIDVVDTTTLVYTSYPLVYVALQKMQTQVLQNYGKGSSMWWMASCSLLFILERRGTFCKFWVDAYFRWLESEPPTSHPQEGSQ